MILTNFAFLLKQIECKNNNRLRVASTPSYWQIVFWSFLTKGHFWDTLLFISIHHCLSRYPSQYHLRIMFDHCQCHCLCQSYLSIFHIWAAEWADGDVPIKENADQSMCWYGGGEEGQFPLIYSGKDLLKCLIKRLC